MWRWSGRRPSRTSSTPALHRLSRRLHTLTRDERDQLGLRLAAKLDLPRVDAVDWLDGPPGKDEDYDFEGYPATPEAKAAAGGAPATRKRARRRAPSWTA